MPKLDIPPDQLERILPVVEPLLADLRERSRILTPLSESALVYQPDQEDVQ